MPKLVYTIEYENDLSSLKSEAKKARQTMDKAFEKSSSSGRKATEATKDQEEALRELRRELRRKISLVDADLRLGNKSQKEAEESISQIKQWAEAQGAFNREQLIGAQNLKTFANAQTRAQTGFKGMSAVTNRANQVLFDLNQGLQDIPFGMRGIGNNIPFVIEGFRRFGKAAREEGVSPLRAFGRALASPAGLIGTAAAVIPTLILLADQFDWFSGKVEEAKSAIEDMNEGWKVTIGLLEQFDAFRDDPFGFSRSQAEIREISDQIENNRDELGRVQRLEQRRANIQREILVSGELGKALLQDQLSIIESQLNRLGEEETIRKNIKELQDEMVNISAELAQKADKLSDEDVKRARQQKLALEIAIEHAETVERTEDAQRELREFYKEQENAAKAAAQARKQELEAIRQMQRELLLQGPPGEMFGGEGRDREGQRIATQRRLRQQFALSQVEGFERRKLRLQQRFQNMYIDLLKQGLATEENLRMLSAMRTKAMEELKRDAIMQTVQFALQALSTAFSESKPIAVAQAVVDGALAVQKALSSAPPPFNFAAAAAVGAATAKQIEVIVNAEPGQGAAINQRFQGTPTRGQGFFEFQDQFAQQLRIGAVTPANFAPQSQQPQINLNAEVRADQRKGLYLLVRDGEKEIDSEVTVV